MPCSFCYYANMVCKPIFAFRAIYHFAFLYRILDFTHNLKKNPFVNINIQIHMHPQKSQTLLDIYFFIGFFNLKSKMFNINFFKEISLTFPTKQYVNGCLQLTFFNFQKLHKIPKIRLVKGFAGLSILNNFLISMTLTLFVGVRIPIPQP